jgi:2,4-dienoyl-CoA reductase-like NADH-dependent reductase (Old Yellow Enzyme family)/thioredoxin reductase
MSKPALLFEPITIGGVHAPNRIVMLPMGSGMPGEDGFANDATIAYYRRRARGGIGMLTVEASLVAPGPSAIGPELRLHDDCFIGDLTRLVDAVHAEGVPVGIQLWHPGRQTNLGESVAPSPVPLSPRTPIPRELTQADIHELVDQYASAAARCRSAGFDYVEVHAAHCYLPCEFLSPLVNQRTDEYGGDLEGRARFLLEIVAAVRAACGEDYPVFCRITGSEGLDGGFDIDEAVQLARLLEQAGISCLSVTAGTWHTLHLSMPPMSMERGCLLPLARRIKAAVDVHVIAAGRLDDPDVAERALADGDADLIGIGRGLIADPDWPRKVREDRRDTITPCIACNACLDLISRADRARCAVNPEVSRELEWPLQPSAVRSRVMVVGGGPTGLEAARVARLRGHEVSVWERDARLGGKLDVASRAPSKHEVLRFRDHQEQLMGALGVEVRLGVEVTPALIEAEDPDVVVIATGAGPLIPPIPGVDGAHVVDAQRILLGEEEIRPGRSVTVIGGSATGCETAEILAAAGCSVTIVEMLPSVGRGIELVTRRQLLQTLRDAGVTILKGCRVVAIERDRTVFERSDGTVDAIASDQVALAIGWVPRGPDFAAALNGRRHLVVGDADRPADFVAAVNAGADAGRAIERI